MDNYSNPYTKKQQLEIQRAELENEISSFLPVWRDCGDYCLPRRTRFFTADANKGDRRNLKIIDSTASMAARTLRAGMTSGITSPARPWFRLTTPDPDMADFAPVKRWLYSTGERMRMIFLKSNLYNVLPIVYGDMGVFGTASMYVEEDAEDFIRCYPFPVGSYKIANNERLNVNVFFRDFRMTVNQLLGKFWDHSQSNEVNWAKFSSTVKNAYDRSEYQRWIDVCHSVRPNEEYDPSLLHSKHNRYQQCYYERGFVGTGGTAQPYENTNETYLDESGYNYFPALSPRWEVTGEDVYATEFPGLLTLGDNKSLQTMQKRKSQAIEKMVNPPMVGPTSMRSQKASILPADITYADEREGTKGFRPAHEVNFRINELLLDIQDNQKRISRGFFEDLFLMLAQSDRREITATEISERKEEKLLALGPVLEQLNQDLLDPLIDITFNIGMKRGVFEEPPEELQGVNLKVEYISMMAQAQKMVGISGIERFAGFVGQVAPVDPRVLNKVNAPKLVDVYADFTSIPPEIVRSDDEVAQIEAQQQKAAEAQKKMEMISQGATAAKDLSQASIGNDSVLTELLKTSQRPGAVA